MKAIINITLIALAVFTFSSCTTKEVAKEAEVTFIFDMWLMNKEMEHNSPFNYINKAGNPYNVSELKYIISKVVLIDLGDNEIELNNYDIIDAFGHNQLDAVTMPNGTYKSMRFTVGVPGLQNFSSDAIGDLVPGGDMHINTSLGYIFFKHKGKFLDGSNSEQPIDIEYSGSSNLQDIEIPIGGLTVNGAAKTAYITFNLNSVYDDATDFNDGASSADVSPNFANAFIFSGSFNN